MGGIGGRGGILGVVGVAALVAVVILVVLFAGGGGYKVTAQFVSASQLVKGNEVRVSGEPIGTVDDIELTDDGQAAVHMTITEDGFTPLREGTRATVRQSSLSGVAGRYVDLQLGGARGKEIPDGGRIASHSTQAAVDLDQLFNTFDPRTRRGLQDSFKFLRDFQAGREDEANAALRYLNPALSSSSRLFAELNRNTRHFERFIDETSHLVTDLSADDDALAGLVSNLATTTDALASRRGRLGEAVELLPSFMRRANSTFVNLRSSLDDLDPLVDDAKPIVRDKLIPLFDQVRPFARGAQPTVRDLQRSIRSSGEDNDLVELLRRQPAVDKIANRAAERNGSERPGAFPASREAFKGASPQLGFLRPYAPDLVGWFDDFSTTGAYDALGAFSRAGLALNGFTLGPALNALPVPPELRNELLGATLHTGRNNRCPGSIERRAPDGSNPYKPSPDFNCDETQVPIGP